MPNGIEQSNGFFDALRRCHLTLIPVGIIVAPMANIDPSRTALGPHFNEGARLLWKVMTDRGWSQADLCRALGMRSTGPQNRWLYGDRRPGRLWSAKLHKRFKIAPAKWDQEPTEPFLPPAAVKNAAPAAVKNAA